MKKVEYDKLSLLNKYKKIWVLAIKVIEPNY